RPLGYRRRHRTRARVPVASCIRLRLTEREEAPMTASRTSDLEQARLHHERRAWTLAFHAFHDADRARERRAEDLERFAQAAYPAGRDDGVRVSASAGIAPSAASLRRRELTHRAAGRACMGESTHTRSPWLGGPTDALSISRAYRDSHTVQPRGEPPWNPPH